MTESEIATLGWVGIEALAEFARDEAFRRRVTAAVADWLTVVMSRFDDLQHVEFLNWQSRVANRECPPPRKEQAPQAPPQTHAGEQVR